MAGMRSIQSLDINLGLFAFPVKVYRATNEPTEGVSFTQLHATKADGTPCHHNINYIKRCTACEQDVQMSEIIKGVEHNGGYLTFTDEEIKALKPERLGVVKIDGYLEDAGSIGDSYYDGTVYYLAPGGKDMTTFVTWRDALAGRAAIGKVVMYGREHVVSIRAVDKVLAMYFLRTHSEIRNAFDVPGYTGIPQTALGEHLQLMAQLMDAKRIEFDDVILDSDSYADAVRGLIEARKAGQPMPVQAGAAPVAPVSDLAAMLKASLAAVQAGK